MIREEEMKKGNILVELKERAQKVLDLVVNLIHCFLILFLGSYVFRAIICVDAGLYTGNFYEDIKNALLQAGINEIFTFIGALAFILFGIVGVYEFAYLNGLPFLVPPIFIEVKEKDYLKQAERMMKVYYKKDAEYIKKHEEERSSYLLRAMGLDEGQYHYVNYQILKARTQSARSIYSLKLRAESTFLHKEFIVDQTSWPPEKRVYDVVDYFLNLYTVVYDDNLRRDLGNILYCYIERVLKERISEIDYVIIPQGSNFLLGLEVGKILSKPIISIMKEERIQKGIYWDGDYKKNKNGDKNKIIVIHDVLVTGKRLYESIEKLPKGSYELLGIYCLARYIHEDFKGLCEFENRGIPKQKVNWLLEVDEKKLQRIYNEI